MRYFVFFLLLAGVAQAQGKTEDCFCTYNRGERVELGDFVCLHVDGRSFIAQCQMSLNNPMWREIRSGCAIS